MSKILLIYPRFSERLRVGLPNLPMSLIYVGSYLSHKGYKVRILDLNNIEDEKDSLKIIRNELNNVIAVGISVMSAQVPNAIDVSKYIKSIDPSIPIIWGGVHPTLYPGQVARAEFVDFVVRGEGEVTAFELIKAIEGHGNFEKIKGITFRSRKTNKIVSTDNRELLDLNKLPSIDWNLVKGITPFKSLKEIAELTGLGIPIQTSRGCPHRCTFCINKVLRTRYRYRKTDLVLKDIENLISLGINSISFLDEDFFVFKERVVEILDGIEEKGLKFKWFANVRADYFRPDYINFEFALRLKKCGCEMVGIGAESGSQKILDMLKKDITVEDIRNSARILSKAGIKASYSWIIGLPGEETEDDIQKSLQLIHEIMREDVNCLFNVGIQKYRPYPGSDLYLECLSEKMNEPSELEEWVGSPFIQTRLSSGQFREYPWINPRIRKNLNNIIFYGSLLAFRSRYQLLNKIIRKIASLRFKLVGINFPVENKLYTALIRRSGLDVHLKFRPFSD